jgi:Putative MetA-pathway of phenol degradation
MKRIALLWLLALPMLVWAQTAPIDTDRPDQTESAFLVPKGWLQFEMGFNQHGSNQYFPEERLLPTLLSKYAINKHIELRLITTVQSVKAYTPSKGNYWETGLQPVEVGAKLHIAEASGWRPQTALIFHFALPRVASPTKRINRLAPNFRFTMQNSITDAMSIGYNLGAEWDGFSSTPAWIYTFAPGFKIGKTWYGYVEAFGSVMKNEKPQHSVDAGIAWYASDDVKIDFSGGKALNNYVLPWYVAVGISARMQVSKKKN